MERTARKTYLRWKDMLCDNLADFYGDENVSDLLEDLEYFKKFTLDPWTVDWNNEIGFAPEYLYEVGIAA